MEQPCISCGRDTRPGTRLYAARKPGKDLETGRDGYLCQACQRASAGLGAQQHIPLSGRYIVIDFNGPAGLGG